MARFERIYEVDDRFLDNIGPAQAWFLGLMAADGCIDGKNHFSLAQSGPHGYRLLAEVQALIGHDGPIATAKGKHHSIAVTSGRIVGALVSMGITPRKTYTLRYPAEMPEYCASAFLRGYVEGDGSSGVYDNGRGTPLLVVSFVGTEEFTEECVARMPIVPLRHKITRCPNLWEVRAHGRKALTLSNWLWQDESLPCGSKQQAAREFLRHHTPRYVRSVALAQRVDEMIRSGETYRSIHRETGSSFNFIAKRKKLAYDTS